MIGSVEVAGGGTACDGKLSWGKLEANCVCLGFPIDCCADPTDPIMSVLAPVLPAPLPLGSNLDMVYGLAEMELDLELPSRGNPTRRAQH